MGDQRGVALVGRLTAAPVQLVRAGGRPVRCGSDADPVVGAVPVGDQCPERGHHVLHRPRVTHRGRTDLVGEGGRKPGQERLVRLVRVDVLVPAHQPERRPQASVPVGQQRGDAAVVLHPGTAVVHVDGAGLASLDGRDQAPQDPVVQVLLVDRADCALDVHVRLLEDVLVQPGPDSEFGVVVAVDEAGHDEVSGRAEHPVERPSCRQHVPGPDRGDLRPLYDQRPVRDHGGWAERDDRIAQNQVSAHGRLSGLDQGQPSCPEPGRRPHWPSPAPSARRPW